ncbi:hypothetical protein PaG_06047 [Moesziomyces aphidis]|uniref:Uncharacterized protein n=1 Tax=Moesziomyces aphidis TaxID=84754 RepID=W3VEI2_MOEAP|nr:hypothetical protein PaG_06047 [Moesziomyces aphidis]
MLFLVLLMVSLWGGSALPVDTTQPEVYSPVQLSQYCNAADNYCYYVDQIHPGTVRASPYTATDEQGQFLLRRDAYLQHPYRVCFGGCCILLDFTTQPGCVHMQYVARKSGQSGHLLARFANQPQKVLGPRSFMPKHLVACPQDGLPVPYAVIAARGGNTTITGQEERKLQIDPVQEKTHTNKPDFFDDVTVQLINT